MTDDEAEGMVKILACKKTDKLLGAWVIALAQTLVK